jgi:uncharacterized protein YjbI with pentapeptide repeats
MEIKHKLTGETLINLYGTNLREANLRGTDLREANLRGADLREADLYGADLREAKGILTFVGERDLLIYFKHKETYYFKIGCMTKTSDEWLRSFSDIGAQNRYSEDTTRLYGDVIKLFIQYDLNLS